MQKSRGNALEVIFFQQKRPLKKQEKQSIIKVRQKSGRIPETKGFHPDFSYIERGCRSII